MKKIIIVITLLLIVGCTKKENNVVTIIKEENNCISSISYPKTTESKLNKQIKKYIQKEQKNFQKNYCSDELERQELNIDFKQNIVNNHYLNITLIKTNQNKKEIKTYIFDTEKNKELTIYDIFTENDLKILVEKIKKESKEKNISNIDDIIKNINNIKIQFDDEYLYIYIENLNIKIPLEELDLKIKIDKDEKIKETYKYKEVNKVIDPNQKVIALTFDDGPSKYTKQIVDLLNEYEANATFFILGNKVEIYSDTLKYLLDSGNEIGNHSYNHKWLTHVTDEELLSQINTTQDIIKNTLNYTPTLLRPTYGSVNKTIKEKVDLEIILWNVDTLDWKYKNSNKIFKNILPKINDGKIVLMHDTYEYTYNTLKLLLPELKRQGYQFVTVSELKEINSIRTELNR